MQTLSKVLAGPAEVRSDFELVNGLLGHLKPELQVASTEAAFAEATRLISDLNGLTPDRIPIEGVQWPVDAGGEGTERLQLPENGKARFKFYATRL